MAANLTPQYLEAEAEYKKAQTAEERLACLKKMYTLLPKHKASEKMQADLKTKISEAKEALDREKKSPKKTGVSYKIPPQGVGQYVILGAPNVGKSRLLTRLTRAAPEVAPRQGDLQFARHNFRVIIKHFVEVAHAKEEDGVRILPFDLQILIAHRAVDRIVFDVVFK